MAPRLSLVVPAFNEEQRIGASLETIGVFLDELDYATEVIVVDDGSAAPGREAAAAAVAALPEGVERSLLRHSLNRGKGAAVRTGCLAARGEQVAFIDADLATPPAELVRLLAALDAGADVAIGLRVQEDGSDGRDRRGVGRRLAGRAFAFVTSRLLLPGIGDSQCPLKAFRRPASQRLFRLQKIDGWAFDAELLYLAARLGLTVAKAPVLWRAMPGSHLKIDHRSVLEATDLARVRWLHRKVTPATLAAERTEPV